jgi:photosystem II stability/assembly factor-like uncharacterized protein
MSKTFWILPFLTVMACSAQEKNTLKSEKDNSPPLFSALETNSILADQYGLIYTPSLDAVSSLTAWVAGEAGGAGVIHKTEDGGQSWAEQLRVADISLDGISAVDAKTLWVSGNLGYVARSLDGGQSWTQFKTGFAGFAPIVSAVDADHAWVQDDDGIIRTQDGGQSWVKLKPMSDLASSVLTFRFVNRDVGYAVAAVAPLSLQTVFKTLDGGLSWSRLTLPELPVLNPQVAYQALSLSVVNADRILIASSLGYTFRSDDAGQNFQITSVFQAPQRDIGCFQMVTPQLGYLAAGDEIFATQDGGRSWNLHKTGTAGLTDRCDFASDGQGIFLNTYGLITRAQ